MYSLSDLSTQFAAPGWIALALAGFDWGTRVDFVRARFGDAVVDLSGVLAIVAAIWLVSLLISGRYYRQKTADTLTAIWDYGLNNLLHRPIDAEPDFHKWLERYGVWQADVLQTMAHRHCSMQQRNSFANLHKFDIQLGLFHSDPYKNKWKSMMSEQLDRLAKVTDELVGRT